MEGNGVLWISKQNNPTPASTLQPIPECSQSKRRAHRVVQNSSWSQTRMCHLPQLFNILLELVMLMALDDAQIGACIQGEQINNLRFADDIVLIAETPEELQTFVNRVYESSSDYGLKINIAKTEVQVISKGKCDLSITINNNRLKQVEDFVYLGGTIADNGSSTNDIKTRIRKAGQPFNDSTAYGSSRYGLGSVRTL